MCKSGFYMTSEKECLASDLGPLSKTREEVGANVSLDVAFGFLILLLFFEL
jgi:hypothetical protein